MTQEISIRSEPSKAVALQQKERHLLEKAPQQALTIGRMQAAFPIHQPLNFSTCLTVKTPSLQDLGAEGSVVFILELLGFVSEISAVKEPWTQRQKMFLAQSIVAKYSRHNLRTLDLWCFANAFLNGEYGKIYDRILPPDFLQNLQTFFTRKKTVAQGWGKEQFSKELK